jgi:xylulose-5-phosphate/fructose-6-phosphate phosphoketolase
VTQTMEAVLNQHELRVLDAYWRAANYLSVGQIYLLNNPLQREPMSREHIKPRLLGHWGTTPGLNFLYAHFNRVISVRGLNMMYVIGPGHGGPAGSSATWHATTPTPATSGCSARTRRRPTGSTPSTS